MTSALYECQVMHARFAPRPHRFTYRIFLFALDLDELDALHRRLPLFSLARPNLFSFREGDFFPTHEPLHHATAPTPASTSTPPSTPRAAAPPSLKARVVAYLATRGVDLAGGRVVLVTLPRVVGYLFNPVSFYFCYDRTGAPVAALAEVTNTFREMKTYCLGPETRTPDTGRQETGDRRREENSVPNQPTARSSPSSRLPSPASRLPSPASRLPSPASDVSSPATFHLRIPKHFYVSPFSDVDVAFDFTLRVPGEKLSVQIDDYAAGARTLTSVLTGTRRALTSARLAWFSLKYPLLTLRVITLIHWHALLLWLKRVPLFPKAARAADQRDLRRPHASLAAPPAAASATAAAAPSGAAGHPSPLAGAAFAHRRPHVSDAA